MRQLRHHLADDGRLRLLPFAGTAVVALASVGSPSRSDGAWWAAIALTLALMLGTLFLPWRRLSDWWQVTVPLAFLTLVAFLIASSEVSRRLVKLTGVASVLFEPVRRGDKTIGVLMAGWLTQRDRIDDQEVAAVRILASEIPRSSSALTSWRRFDASPRRIHSPGWPTDAFS